MVFRSKENGRWERWRPRKCIRAELHDGAALCLACSDVIEGKCTIGPYRTEDGGFREIEADGRYGFRRG